MVTQDASLLIVDDDPRICRTIGRIASKNSIDTKQLIDPRKLPEIYQNCIPSKIVLDLSMPGFDGLDALRFFGSVDATAQICLISGHSGALLKSAHKLGQMLGLNMTEPLSKPLSMLAIEEFLLEDRPGCADRNPSDLMSELEEDVTSRLSLVKDVATADIKRGIKEQEILPFYQPVVDMRNGRLESLEALCRWEHPEHGRILPGSFLPNVVDCGQMDSMTVHLLSYTLDDMRCWESMGITPNVSVNLCPSMLTNDLLIDMLIANVAAAGIEPSRICFEITEETDCCASPDIVRNTCKLRLAGFNLALDDFGAGYASLEKLQAIPFSVLKIDRQFVFQLVNDADAMAIVNSAISLAKDLNIAVIAEGIENEETAKWLVEHGCHLGQGFFLSKPQDFNQVISTIKSRTQQNSFVG